MKKVVFFRRLSIVNDYLSLLTVQVVSCKGRSFVCVAFGAHSYQAKEQAKMKKIKEHAEKIKEKI